MERPYVTCHMLMSLDGKVSGDFLNDSSINSLIEYYYQVNRELPKEAIALGRVTMEESFTKGYSID